MTIVLDTNILLVAIARNSNLHLIFQELVRQKYILAVSTEILLEYEEILQRKLGTETATSVITFLSNLPNIRKIDTHFLWGMIENDWDDNKFIDCAVAAGATYIVSDDAHFRILKKIDFPPLNLLTGEEFVEVLKGNIN
jgi:putative PIN family toxin of toxin-antitoxin system